MSVRDAERDGARTRIGRGELFEQALRRDSPAWSRRRVRHERSLERHRVHLHSREQGSEYALTRSSTVGEQRGGELEVCEVCAHCAASVDGVGRMANPHTPAAGLQLKPRLNDVLVKPLRQTDRLLQIRYFVKNNKEVSASPTLRGAHYAGHVWNGRMHA